MAYYFVRCIWERLYTSNIKEFTNNLLLFKQAVINSEHRTKIYNDIYTEIKKNKEYLSYSNNDIIQKYIDLFFPQFEMDESKNFNVFDKIIKETLLEWLDFIIIHHINDTNGVHSTHTISGANSHNNIIQAKAEFYYFLSTNINKVLVSFGGKESPIIHKQIKEYIEFLQSKIPLTKEYTDKSTQT